MPRAELWPRQAARDGSLVELIELRDHPWFLACQFHPEFQSRSNKPHPSFKGFIGACLAAGERQ